LRNRKSDAKALSTQADISFASTMETRSSKLSSTSAGDQPSDPRRRKRRAAGRPLDLKPIKVWRDDKETQTSGEDEDLSPEQQAEFEALKAELVRLTLELCPAITPEEPDESDDGNDDSNNNEDEPMDSD